MRKKATSNIIRLREEREYTRRTQGEVETGPRKELRRSRGRFRESAGDVSLQASERLRADPKKRSPNAAQRAEPKGGRDFPER